MSVRPALRGLYRQPTNAALRRFLLCARGIIIAADTVRTDLSVRPVLRGLFTYYERNGRFESTAWLYSEALSASPCRAFGHGIRSSVFYQGEPGDVADLKRAVCCQSVYTFDGGDSDDRHALCFYRTSDTDPEEKLSSYPAHAAPGRIFLRISDGFRRVGGPRDLISCVLAAVGPLPDRYFSSGSGSKPGSESGRRSARRRGRSSCDLPGAPG